MLSSPGTGAPRASSARLTTRANHPKKSDGASAPVDADAGAILGGTDEFDTGSFERALDALQGGRGRLRNAGCSLDAKHSACCNASRLSQV